jgi:hypothetical protein
MGSHKLKAVKYGGWVSLGVGLLLLSLGCCGIGPEREIVVGVALIVISVLWLLRAAPVLRRQLRYEEAVTQRLATLAGKSHAAGDKEKILRTASLRLESKPGGLVWLSPADKVIGGVIGVYEMGRLWVTVIGSDERALLELRCANPGAWYQYGYKRKVRWSVVDSTNETTVGEIELRPTFLGRFKWPIRAGKEPEFGEVKAGVEWSRLAIAPAGAMGAAIAPNLEHHATVCLQSCPVCAISWSGHSAALTFVDREWNLRERQLALAVAVLLACCPNYYRNA